MNSIPESYFNPETDKSRSKHLSSLLNQPEYHFVKASLDFLQKYMNHADYDELFISFNGGKDATIVLYLTLLAKMNSQVQDKPLKCIYFAEPEPFEEIDQFIASIRSKISIEWNQLPSKKYQQELTNFSQQRKMKYVVMGSRKDDPYCQHLGMATSSDTHKGYPSFIRLNPIIFWTYDQVWTFIRDFQIPYCSLYDQGFTSLGNKSNTTKNPTLFDHTSNSFKRAFEAHSESERRCRLSKP